MVGLTNAGSTMFLPEIVDIADRELFDGLEEIVLTFSACLWRRDKVNVDFFLRLASVLS